MKARFATACMECGDQIKPGKEIAKNNSGKWVHLHCTDESTQIP